MPRWLPSARAGWQQNFAPTKSSPVRNWRCRLMQVDLYNGRNTVVVVVVVVVDTNLMKRLTEL